MKHFRCACGAVNELTTMNHPSQTYCGLCKTAPAEVIPGAKTAEYVIIMDPPKPLDQTQQLIKRKEKKS
jgi:hypothetical protein